MINTYQEGDEKYPTLFGFKTDNKFAANALNTVYSIVMTVSVAFAYYALSLILVGWPMIMTFLAALAVVGLPYCVKIILYGRKEFTLKMAYLCIAISILPTIFDFIGFYAKTSVRQSLVETKFEVLEKINYFDKEARDSITQNIIQLDQNFNAQLVETDKKFNEEKAGLTKQVLDAEQTYIDETEGVQGRSTSGKVGIGPKAKELESELRRKQAETDLSVETLDSNKKREIDRITKDYETEKASLQEGITIIDDLTKTGKDSGIVIEVTKAQTFDELAETLIRLNSSINVISSKLKLEPEYIKFSTENIIQLSFGALMRWEITAVICFALAVLLELVDTVIVYMIRGSKKKEDEASNQIETKPLNQNIEPSVENDYLIPQTNSKKKIVNVR
jgi:hypothetical protein